MGGGPDGFGHSFWPGYTVKRESNTPVHFKGVTEECVMDWYAAVVHLVTALTVLLSLIVLSSLLFALCCTRPHSLPSLSPHSLPSLIVLLSLCSSLCVVLTHDACAASLYCSRSTCCKYGNVQDDSGNTVIRGEPPAQAIELDRKMLQAWGSHRRRVVCHNVVKLNSNVPAAGS